MHSDGLAWKPVVGLDVSRPFATYTLADIPPPYAYRASYSVFTASSSATAPSVTSAPPAGRTPPDTP